jgi:hypothetical protein
MSAEAYTYYLDSEDGNDNADGLSPGSAWQTISKLDGITLTPGQSVGFKRGCVWRESLLPGDSGSSGHLITYGAYGSGDRPELNGSDLVTGLSNSGWLTDFTRSNSGSGTYYSNVNVRSVIEADSVDSSGSKIRITIRAKSDHNLVITGASIGRMTTGAVYDSAPTRITWDSGANGTTVSSGQTKLSDEITFSFDKTLRYGIHLAGAILGATYDDTVGGTAEYDNYSGTDGSQDTAFNIEFSGGTVWALIKFEVYGTNPANVYSASISGTATQLFRNSVRCTPVASIGDLDTQNECYLGTAGVVYLYSTSDPSGDTVEASVRPWVIEADGVDYLYFRDLSAQKSAGVGWGCHNASYITAKNLDTGWGGGAGLYPCFGGGTDHVTVEGGTTHDNGGSTLYDQNQIAMGGIGGSSNSSYITIDGVDVEGTNYSYSDNTALQLATTDTGYSVTNLVIKNCIFHGDSGGTAIRSDGKGHGVIIHHNVVYGFVDGILHIDGAGGSGTTTMEVYHNTITTNSGDGLVLDGATCTVKDNILYQNASSGGYYEIRVTSAATLTSDYNDFYHSAGGSYFSYQGVDRTFATWKSSTGGDIHSSDGNPLFTDPNNHIYTLQGGSPALETGIYISGISTADPPNMGAK